MSSAKRRLRRAFGGKSKFQSVPANEPAMSEWKVARTDKDNLKQLQYSGGGRRGRNGRWRGRGGVDWKSALGSGKSRYLIFTNLCVSNLENSKTIWAENGLLYYSLYIHPHPSVAFARFWGIVWRKEKQIERILQ